MQRAHKRILGAALIVEVAIFALIAPNFFTAGNFFEIARLNVELGLLAIALTPILITGGIDLSVGAMMGLSAVCFGAAWRDWQLAIPAAAGVAIAVGAAGGGLNALLISRLNLPPLIVTLGTFALFRGIAEGMTEAAVSYTGFPASFLHLGQGYLWGVIPVQLPVFLAVLLAYSVLLRQSVYGRSFYAIGFSPGSARHSGIPVGRRIALVYLLSGLLASVAAIVYVAHLGQARSDAGNGYELDAITAVVLGGTSVFGGYGSIGGSVLGLLALSVLKNGLHLAALPSELIGVVTGVLLVATIAIEKLEMGPGAFFGTDVEKGSRRLFEGELDVKNSQVAVLCAAILGGSLMVAATNVWLVRSLGSSPESAGGAGVRPVIAMMPKAKGDPYFVSCRIGAEEAAKELGIELIWDGPTGLDAARQSEMVENWITRGVDVIAVAVENRAAISTSLRKARQRGIHVITWDADAEPDARTFFVNQATAEGIGTALTDEAARLLDGKGEFAIITGALSAANQNEWIGFIKKRLAERHPDLTLATIRPSDDDRDKAFAETQTILRAFPNVNKPYVHDGTVQTVMLWNTADLGYLAVQAGAQLVRGTLREGATSMDAGRLGSIEIRGAEIILGPPLFFRKDNIDQFDF